MRERLRRFLTPPVFEDDQEKTRAADVFNYVLRGVLFTLILLAVVVPFLAVRQLDALVAIGVLLFTVGIAHRLMRLARIRCAAYVLIAGAWVVVTAAALLSGGVTSPMMVWYAAIPVLAGLFLGTWACILAVGVCAATALGFVSLDVTDLLPHPYSPFPAHIAWITFAAALLITAAPVNAALRSLAGALADARERLAERDRAEIALARRTKQLEMIRTIGAEITRELELVDVLRLISDRLSQVVGYGRGGVCLWDDAAQCLFAHTKLNEPDREKFGLKLGQGVAGRAAHTRQGLVVNDYQTRPGIPPEVRARTKITAIMAEPLVYRDRLVGVIHMDTEDPGVTFTEHDQELLRLVAPQAAIAIEHARVYEGARRRNEELASLLRATRAVMGERDLPQILVQIVTEAAEITGCAHVKLLLVDPETGVLRVGALRGTNLPTDFQMPVGSGLSGRVAATGQPLFVMEPGNDPTNVLATSDRETGMVTYLGLPVKTREQVLGVLTFNTTTAHRYTQDELSYLGAFADQAAIAIEHARLFREEQQRREQLEAIRMVSAEIARELDIDRLLDLILRRAVELSRAEAGAILLWNDEDQKLFPRVRIEEFFGGMPKRAISLGEGLVGRVAAERKGAIVNDYRTWAGARKEILTHTEIVATLAEPLLYRDTLIGVINLSNTDRKGPFQEHHGRILRLFADQAAIAIENARLYDAARRELAERTQAEESLAQRTRQLEAVRAISEEIIREIHLPALLELIVDHAVRLVHGAGGSVLLWDEEEHALVPSVRVGRPAATHAARIALGEGISGAVAAQRKGMLLNDYRSSPLARAAILQHTKISASVAEPLLYQERLVGVINIDNGDTGRTFAPEHSELLRLFAAQAAIAIEHARLFQEQQRAYEGLQRAQEESVRTEKLRALGQMSAGIAHDLNNMLAAILGQAELLRLQVTLPEVQDALKVLYTAASDGAQVVRRLLEFGRQHPGRPLIPCDLVSLVDEALEITRPRWQDEAQEQGRLVEVWRAVENLPRVQGNPAEIREALTNLFLNAVDAMPTGGRLTVAGYAETDATDRDAPGRVVLTVSDTGTGMTEETRRRVFDPFFTTKGFKGTGLGLAVVYSIMERHGGRIDVASAPGQGTTFTLRFREAVSARAEAGDAKPPLLAAGLRLLVIDDEEPVRMTIASLLRAVGHTVIEAEGGDQGLACLTGDSLDLVITDLGMPGMTGWEVAQRIKARQPDLPVILLTGWGHQIPDTAREQNAVAMVLAKPVRLVDLQDAIARVTTPHRGE